MAALYLKACVDELRRAGDVVFTRRYMAPVLVVTARAAELVGDEAGRDRTLVAAPTGESSEGWALIGRVFPLQKAAHAPRGPIVLGRSSDADVAIAEYSISKRHCFFELQPRGAKITDCGSTNHTLVDGKPLPPGQAAELAGGETITLGRFAFAFYTPAGFHAHVKALLG